MIRVRMSGVTSEDWMVILLVVVTVMVISLSMGNDAGFAKLDAATRNDRLRIWCQENSGVCSEIKYK